MARNAICDAPTFWRASIKCLIFLKKRPVEWSRVTLILDDEARRFGCLGLGDPGLLQSLNDLLDDFGLPGVALMMRTMACWCLLNGFVLGLYQCRLRALA